MVAMHACHPIRNSRKPYVSVLLTFFAVKNGTIVLPTCQAPALLANQLFLLMLVCFTLPADDSCSKILFVCVSVFEFFEKLADD
jgi:hypothetical protein